MPLALHEFHQALGARFTEINGCEVVNDYGDPLSEHTALHQAAGALDLSFRGRICVTGGDRLRFLNGQVTNNVRNLAPGRGCYAALVTAKGKLQSDLNIYCLADELLLDFEPGLSQIVTERLEKFIIADDAQIVDAGLYYGLLSVQGPKSEAAVRSLALPLEVPEKPFEFAMARDPLLGENSPRGLPLPLGEGRGLPRSSSRAKAGEGDLRQSQIQGEIYLINHPRLGTQGYDLFVPVAALGAVMDKLIAAADQTGGRACGWQALETARIEAGIPRFGVDMDESNLAPEALDERAISYSKGCYIGQEVIARIRTYSEVQKALRVLRLADDLKTLPVKGDKLFRDGKEAGFITSAVASPALKANVALGYVRKGSNEIATELILRTTDGESPVRVVNLPFAAPASH